MGTRPLLLPIVKVIKRPKQAASQLITKLPPARWCPVGIYDFSVLCGWKDGVKPIVPDMKAGED